MYALIIIFILFCMFCLHDLSLQSVLASIGGNINTFRSNFASRLRSQVKDWYQQMDNEQLVNYVSIFMISLMAVTSGLQTYFVRKLFSTPKVTPGANERA